MLRILVHKASGYEFGLSLQQLFIAHKAEVIGDIFVYIGFRDVNASEHPSLLIDFGHESIRLKGLVDAGKYH